jgi:formyltetrahydrofolate deformylase
MTMRQVLLIDCEDQKGLVAKVSTELFSQGVNITSNREFVDPVTNRFFMRTEFEGEIKENDIVAKIKSLLSQGANVRLARQGKKKLVILGTKEPHCLGDILIRCAYNALNATIEAVICNRDTLRSLVEKFGVPFHFVDHKDKERTAHAEEIRAVADRYAPDYLVLAKYMRILPEAFVSKYENRIINIHHSFLPAFVGANPYRQAHERGVKIIGATAHFVSADLDQGPIIGQDVIPINHRYTAKNMAAAGRDVEKTVLAKALSLVVDDCVFVNGNKTVVFG